MESVVNASRVVYRFDQEKDQRAGVIDATVEGDKKGRCFCLVTAWLALECPITQIGFNGVCALSGKFGTNLEVQEQANSLATSSGREIIQKQMGIDKARIDEALALNVGTEEKKQQYKPMPDDLFRGGIIYSYGTYQNDHAVGVWRINDDSQGTSRVLFFDPNAGVREIIGEKSCVDKELKKHLMKAAEKVGLVPELINPNQYDVTWMGKVVLEKHLSDVQKLKSVLESVSVVSSPPVAEAIEDPSSSSSSSSSSPLSRRVSDRDAELEAVLREREEQVLQQQQTSAFTEEPPVSSLSQMQQQLQQHSALSDQESFMLGFICEHVIGSQRKKAEQIIRGALDKIGDDRRQEFLAELHTKVTTKVDLDFPLPSTRLDDLNRHIAEVSEQMSHRPEQEREGNQEEEQQADAETYRSPSMSM